MRKKSGTKWAKLTWLLTFSFLAFIVVFSCEQTTGPSNKTVTITKKLLIYSDISSMPTNGGSAHILVKVYSGSDTANVVNNVRVQFSATLGSVQSQNELTDANGFARAIAYAGSRSGTMGITASIENYSNTIFVSVTPGAGLVFASPSEILADGRSQSMVSATVIDSLGQPLPGALVRFVATAGTVTAQSYTNELGKAEAALRSVASTTDVSSTVTASTSTGKIAAVTGDSGGVEKPAAVQGVLGSTTVVFKGITISGSAEKNTVFANDADSTTVKITVKETTSGAPVPNARLALSSNLGRLRAQEAVTDKDGNISVIFFGSNLSGVAVVKASLEDQLAFSTEISLTKQLYMTIMSSPSSLAANGSDTAEIKAQITDSDGNPIQGEKVYFSTSLGTILPSAETDLWGFAKVNLRSPRYNGVAEVKAKFRTIEKITYVEFTGAEIKLQAAPIILVANDFNSSTLSVTLNDASGSPVVGSLVTFSTTLGNLYTADGKLSGASITDSTSTTGKITAYLKSSQPGDAVVTVSTTGIRETITVHFTEYMFSLSSSATEVLAGGRKIQITATLRNKEGEITPIDIKDVDFSTTLGSIVPVGTSDGQVVAELTSGNSAGTATVTANMKEPPISSSISIPFIAADADSVVIKADRMSVRLGGDAVDIRATVYDVTGNPTVGSTVTFTILKGPGGGEEITPGSAVTNDRGQAVVTFKSGTRGSDLDGVEIQAKVKTRYSNIIKLTIAGEPYSVIVGFTSNFVTNSDGTYSVGVSVIVSDVNRNKVIDNTIVNFSITKGDVGIIEGQVPTKDGVASTQLVYSPSDAGKEVEVTASSGGIIDRKLIKLPGKAGTIGDLRVSPKESTILGDGISVESLVIYLTGMNGEPLSNMTVYCELLANSKGLGKIDPSALTGDPSKQDSSPGKANVVYTGAATHEDRMVGIRVYAGDKADTVYVNLKGITMTASADPAILPPDGQSRSTINVLIKETTTNIPITGQEVRFGASHGYIGGKASTDGNGVARTTFIAPKDTTITAENPLVTTILVSFGNKLEVTIPLVIREIRTQGLELFASPTQIPANGSSTSAITALLRDNNSNPVVGEIIMFTTDLGTITAVDSTDANGRADAILVSDRKNGQAHITARYKNTTRTIPVNFIGVKLNVSATPENLFAGGNEQTTVTAFVKDAAEVAIVGEMVTFEWFLNGSRKDMTAVQTDVSGRASLNISATEAGQCLIRVSAAGAVDSTYVTFNRTRLTIEGRAESAQSGMDSLSVSTGGDSILVWAQLYDTVNDLNVPNSTVEFYTTLGTIGKTAVTNSQGIASTYLKSGSTAGTATVLATTYYQNQRISKEKQFTFVPSKDVGTVSLRVDPNIVAINGGSSALIAVVTDRFGNPISDALVSFQLLKGPAGGEYIHPITSTTGTSGVATTYFYSGQVPSAFENVHLQAEVGGVSSNLVKLTIAGAPETIQPSYPTLIDIGKIDNGNGTFTLPISATILDINSNHVVDGTTVYFKIDPPEGTVSSPVKTTNSVATSQITYPATSAGKTVELTASAGGKEGKIRIPLPGFTVTYLSVTATPGTIVADGKSTSVIRATLFDYTGSSASIPDGMTVSFTTDGGTVNPAVAITTNGVATTTLTSDKNPRQVSITAQSGSAKDVTWVKFDDIVSYLTVSAKPKSIPADGVSTSEISATLFNNIGEYVPDGISVSFSTDGGTLGTIVETTTNGVAKTVLTSSKTPQNVIVSAQSGLAKYSTQVTFENIVSHIVLEVSPNNLPANGKSTATVSATVLDKEGKAVQNGVLVTFSADGGTLSKVVVPTLDGVASTTLTSGKVERDVTITAQSSGVSATAAARFEEVIYYPDMIATPGVLPADGKSTSQITVTMKDNDGNSIPDGTVLSFTSEGLQGIILNPLTVTTKNGVATLTVTSGTSAGTLTLTVTIGKSKGMMTIVFEEVVSFISVATSKNTLVADGKSTCTIIATLHDSKGNLVDGTPVTFYNDGGTLSNIVMTTQNGVASTTLTSDTIPKDVKITAVSGAYMAQTTVTFEAITYYLTITASPKSIPADGVSTSAIQATLKDASGNPIPDGTSVTFATSSGAIAPKSAITTGGNATALLTSDKTPADITVTVTSGTITDTIKVRFEALVSYISVVATPMSIAADGKTTTEIKATLKNSTGDNSPDGTVVSFSTTLGVLDPSVVKTQDGIARTTLKSTTTPGDAVVTVASGTVRETVKVTFEEVGASVNEVAEIDLSVSNSVIEADGKTKSYITATLYRYEKGARAVVTTPTTVIFESDIGDISKFVQSDTSGKAVAQFTSGVVGTASISAKVGTVTSHTNVVMVPGKPQSIQLSFTPTTVGVKKSGRNETLQIIAKVVDNKTNPVGDGNLVRFEMIGAHDDSVSITPNDGVNRFRSEPVPTVNGMASVSFHSGTRAGTIRVKATMVDSLGAVITPIIASETTQFMVVSGPAFLDTSNPGDPFTNSRMTVVGWPRIIFAEALNTDESKTTISVQVCDRYNNPVPEGTAVYCTTTGGNIYTTTGFTNAQGIATVTLFAGNPFPTLLNSGSIENPNKSIGGPDSFIMSDYLMPSFDFDGDGDLNNGVAIVTAQTQGVDQNGRQVTVWNYVPVVFTKWISVFTAEPATTNLLNGQSTIITITVHDTNKNPVIPGTEITITTDLGAISTSKITTDDLGSIKYYVTLTNNIDPINGTPGNTVVTVKLKNKNHELQVSTVPIYMSTSTQ